MRSRLRGLPSHLLSIILCIASFRGFSGADPPPFNHWDDYDRGRLGNFIETSFMSTDLKAPRVNLQHWSNACVEDDKKYVFAIHSLVVSPVGPIILDKFGHMIWHREDFGNAYNLQVQRYKGQDVLTFWAGDDTLIGHGTGYYYMVRSSHSDLSHPCAEVER